MKTVLLGELIAPAQVRRAGGADLPVLSMTMHGGLVDQSAKFKKRVASADTSDYKVVRRGQLVVGFPIDEGVLDFQSIYAEGIVSPAYGLWDLRDETSTDWNYLRRFLRSPAALGYYKAKLRGSTARRRSLPTAVFLELPVPHPPIDKQRHVAAILDHVDGLRALSRRSSACLDDLAKSMFAENFRDELNGQMRPLSSVVEEFRYGTSMKSSPHGDPVLRIPNVVGGALELSDLKSVALEDAEFERLRLLPGDLLFVRTNGNRDNVGRCAVVSRGALEKSGFPVDRFVYASYLIRARLSDEVIPEFVSAYLNGVGRSQLARRAKTSAGQFNVNIEGLGSIGVPLPPSSRQREFVRSTAKIDLRRARCGDELAKLDELFAALQSQAFSGRL